MSDLYFPIFEGTPKTALSDEVVKRKLVGALTCYVYWQVYFNNILPSGTKEVIAVLENSCGQQFTYSVVGDEAQYAGPGDLHNPKFGNLEVTTGFGAFLGDNANAEEEGMCVYTVRVFPSQEFEDSFLTNRPIYFTMTVLATFVFTSIVFLLYDWIVEKRQKITLQKAVQSTEVVNALFPAGKQSVFYVV